MGFNYVLGLGASDAHVTAKVAFRMLLGLWIEEHSKANQSVCMSPVKGGIVVVVVRATSLSRRQT
jgi:hypothetical protein